MNRIATGAAAVVLVMGGLLAVGLATSRENHGDGTPDVGRVGVVSAYAPDSTRRLVVDDRGGRGHASTSPVGGGERGDEAVPLDLGVPSDAIWTSDGDAIVIDGDDVRIIVTDPLGADLNGDRRLDRGERLALVARFRDRGGDLDGDGSSTLLDVGVLLRALDPK